MKRRILKIYAIVTACIILHVASGLATGLPVLLRNCLPEKLERAASLYECHLLRGFRDQYDIRVYSLPGGWCDAFLEEASQVIELNALPMTEEEQTMYLENCCNWAVSACDFVSNKDFSETAVRGWWWYSGTYDANKEEPFGYLGYHEMLIWLEGGIMDYLVYMEVDI